MITNYIISSTKGLLSLFLAVGALFLCTPTANAQDVIRASGGTGLSIDSVATGGYSLVSGPNIRETASGQLAQGETIVLTLPSGYEWNPNSTVTVTTEPTGAANTQLDVSLTSISATEATFTVDSESNSRGNGQGPGRVDIEGLEIRPANTNIPDSGQITNTGTTGPAGVNYGDLSKEAGEPAEIRVETASDGSGQVVQEQDLIAGVDLQVFAIARDIGGNFVENIALSDESAWSLINVTGNIPQSALQPASNLRSAIFSSEQTGTAQIEAFFTDLTAVPSAIITILPREADKMVITTQPSGTATAGEAFNTQPVIELRDQFDNIVTTDNSTEVTTSINSGNGTLNGTLNRQANNGIISYTDLFAETANTISLKFESPDLNTVVSNEIVVEPAAPFQLTYLEDPSNTLPGNIIDPPIELQLLDEFDNEVNQENVDVSITEVSANFLDPGATTTVSTNSDGIAIFDNLLIDSGSSEGEVQLEASFSGISSAAISTPFYILAEGELAEFLIEAEGGGNISDQIAGEAFNIQITAIDGAGNTVTDFSDSVFITADANISNGDGETASFTNGVLSSHSLTLTSSGPTHIYAENSDIDRDGDSNEFNITPADFNVDSTTISASSTQITADGNSTSTITVQARDEFGNSLVSGGETIQIVTDNGTLSSSNGNDQTSLQATDNGDGTYTAVLTSSTNIETATVKAFLNDQNGDKLGEVVVDFTAGDLATFSVEVPQDNGTAATQTAGVPFDITVKALDANDNIIEGFAGNLIFTSNSDISAGSTADESGFSNGELIHSITLTRSGENITITVEEDNLDEESGTSEPFEVIAGSPDANSSGITANPVVIQNDGSSESMITVTLRDEFGNQVLTQENVTLSLEQLEENGNPSSGQPDATISGVTFNSTQHNYTATLTSSTTLEVVEISASFNGTPITQTVQVDIVVPNTWTAGAGGPAGNRTDWTNPDNWSLGTVPTENDFVIIPDEDDLPILDLNISVGSFEIQNGANLTLFGGNAISVSGNLTVDGILDIEDNTNISIGGNFAGNGTFTAGTSTTVEIAGNITLGSYLAGQNNSITRLNGENQQILDTENFLFNRLEIRNDVLAEADVDLIDIFELDISQGNTFELVQDGDITVDLNENITGDGTFILNNNTFVLRGNSELSNIDASEGTVIFGIRLDEDFANFPDLQQQQIANLSEMQNAIINNTEGVRTFDDIIVEGDLTLENGELIISSGKSLIAPNQIYNNGSLQIRRTINNKGWVMMSAPINTTFSDLFGGLTVQGIPNSTYPNRQPNLLYYDETIPGTDNQRWRAPGDISESIQHPDSTGRGYFFFVFGDVASDGDYNDTLPKTLTVNGEETQPAGGTAFEFTSVTYTADADTGWNLVGNPFAATIDWDDEANWTKTNMDNVIYVWDPARNDYLYWNGIDGGTLDGEELNDGKIKPFQAFWVKANAPDPVLAVDESGKTTGGTFRGKSDREPASIGFKLEADTLEKATYITLSPDGKTGKDHRDAFRLLPFETDTYLEFYSTFEDGTQLAINNLARDFGKEITIPLHVDGFKDGVPISGEYTISWPKFGDVPDSWTLILEDQQTGQKTNLRTSTFYSFNVAQSKTKTAVKNNLSNFQLVEENARAKTANNKARFLLRIEPGADADGLPSKYSLDNNYPNPFTNHTTIEFATPIEGRVEILAYDILGRKVKTLLNANLQADFHEVQWAPSQLASGVYIIIMRANGRQFSKKVTYIK